jgi:serine phosphatase RsbU (regulator of sigma subunit)
MPPARTLEYAGACLQARQVGGDYYDFLDLGQNRLGLVLGDIAGKGMAAALLIANLQTNLRSQCAIAADEPQRFLRSVNQLFFEYTADGDYAHFSSRNMTTKRGACVTRTADICPRFCCGAMARWSNSHPLPRF